MKKIVVAGATGNLGTRIVHSLIAKGADVHVIVRSTTDPENITGLEKAGVIIHKVDMTKVEEIAKACTSASCVVSALAGLREVIIDTQKTVLDAAIMAGVPRFIPSDYSLDFTKFSAGENRNLDWRREFHTILDATSITATSIFNGAFMDMLTGQMPLILFKKKLVLYWGHADHRMTFTTVQDTAVFTANAALDDSTPRFLRIAGDQLSPREIKDLMSVISRKKYRLFRAGGLGLLSTLIKIARRIAPGEKDLYPAWQGMQYMRNMIDKRGNLDSNDNNRYPDMHWTTVKDLLTDHQMK